MSKQDPAEKLAEATAEAREVLREVRGALRDLAAARKDAETLVSRLGHEIVVKATEEDLQPRINQIRDDLHRVTEAAHRGIQRSYDRIAMQASASTVVALNAALKSIGEDPGHYLINRDVPVKVVLGWSGNIAEDSVVMKEREGYETLVYRAPVGELVDAAEAVDPLRIQR